MARHYGFSEKLAIYEMIKANGAPDAAGEYWVYDANWSDDRVAQACDAAVAVVQGIRREQFGEIKKGGFSKGHAENMFSRLKEVEAKVDQVVARLDALERRPANEDGRRLVEVQKLPSGRLVMDIESRKPNGA